VREHTRDVGAGQQHRVRQQLQHTDPRTTHCYHSNCNTQTHAQPTVSMLFAVTTVESTQLRSWCDLSNGYRGLFPRR
jgi:hypothetical protein